MSETCTLECTFEHETPDAVLVWIDGEKQWIPLSQVRSRTGKRDLEGNFKGAGEIEITLWFAETKGLV